MIVMIRKIMVTVQGNGTEELTPPRGPSTLASHSAGSVYDAGAEGNDLVDYYAGRFFHNKAMAVKQCYDRIWSFFNTDDMVRVNVECLPVHTCKKNHVITGAVSWFYVCNL